MKRGILSVAIVVLIMTSVLRTSVFAAPQKMPDGQIFDPQFYAQTYPDVVAALGTDTNILYQHYLNNGKKEGRLPYAPGSNTSVTVIADIPSSAMAKNDGVIAFRTIFDLFNKQGYLPVNNINKNSTEIVEAPLISAFNIWKTDAVEYPVSAVITNIEQAPLGLSTIYSEMNPYYVRVMNQFIRDSGIDQTYITSGQCKAFRITYFCLDHIGGRGRFTTTKKGYMYGIVVIPTGAVYCGGQNTNSCSMLTLSSLNYSGNMIDSVDK